MIIAIILLIAVLLIVIWGISTVNGFKKKEIRVQEGLSGVEVALTILFSILAENATIPIQQDQTALWNKQPLAERIKCIIINL